MLASVPTYFPPAGGRYEIKPGLVRFGRELGAGAADRHVFQIDSTFDHYRRKKLAARRERLDKYFLTHRLAPAVQRTIADFIIQRLTSEHPEHFTLDDDVLACGLTGGRLQIASDSSVLDSLACQIQEDLAIVSSAPNGSHWLSAIHLCFPNNWAAGDKIGRAFSEIHEPVAGMGPMNRQSDQLVGAMLAAKDGLVRFAWGITWDDELNHHPELPPGMTRASAFDPANPRAFLRVERQTIWGFTEVGAALFTIRTYLHDCAEIRGDARRREDLANAMESMTPESLAYKGLAESRDELLRWLRG